MLLEKKKTEALKTDNPGGKNYHLYIITPSFASRQGTGYQFL